MSKPNTKRGLGRGLNALFEDEEETVYAPAASEPSAATTEPAKSGRGRAMLGVEQLTPGKLQPRQEFDEEALNELAESIKAHGLLQPILVRADKTQKDKYEIIAGERRWRASQLAQLHEVPVVVLEITDVEALEIGLVENLQREDLNPVEEASGYKRLMDEFGHTQEKLAEIVGRSRPHIANMVRLLTLPSKVLEYLKDGDISIGHARALVTAKDAEALAKEIVAKNLSVRQAEALAAETSDRPLSKSAAKAKAGKDTDTLALERDLSNTLGMRVTIDAKNGKGNLKVEFKNLDQLDDLIQRLNSTRRLAG